MEVREKLLRFLKLIPVASQQTQTSLTGAAHRKLTFASHGCLLLLAAVSLGANPVQAQIAVPKYQSPLDAPRPEPATLPAPTAITPNASVVEYPIARVNEQIIDSSDYQRAQQQLAEEAQKENVGSAELEQRQKDLLRDMIDQQLLLSRGKELDINADSEVIRRLDDIRKENHFDTMEDLEKAVRQSGLSYEDFKSNIKNIIITQEVERDEVARKLAMTARQEQAYYEAHKQDFALPEQVRLSEILIATPDDATDAQIAQAQAKAQQVVDKLKAGAKFEDLATQYSGGQTADKGGDLGEFKRGALAKVLEDQTFDLKPGEFTAPIRTRQGFVVLKVTEHTAAGIPPLSAVDALVQQAAYEEAMKPALRAYLTDLRDKAFIEIQPGFIDTGASPKQTKAVFAASTPPPVKKKAAKKARLEQARTVSAAGSQTSTAATNPSIATTKPFASAAPVTMASAKRRKKIKREKIRFGQAPPESLPAAPEETLGPGSDQGAGATPSTLPAPGAVMESNQQTASMSSDEDPLAPKVVSKGKTRYSDRAPTEAKVKAAVKVAKAKQKAAAAPSPLTAEEKETKQAQAQALGLGVDTSGKKKKKKIKGAPKERMQQQPPAPPTPKPEANPIPPKSVRDNGEPTVTPPVNPSTLPSVTAPAPGTPVDMTPSTPANPAPSPVPQK
jgi:peptidyl-prolyl cis-trans isomerase SurA